MFTPDGLLKQVEYASLTPSHCTPMVIVPIILSSDEDSIDSTCLIILASISTDTNFLDNDGNNNDDDDDSNKADEKNSLKLNERRGQSRIIQIPISTPALSSNINMDYDTGSSLLIGINGLLPDCISLIRHARDDLHSYQRTYGIHRLYHTSNVGKNHNRSSFDFSSFTSSSSCALRFAKSIADKCQKHSFGGGLRPFGSKIVVCGVDKTIMNVYITDPSGAIDHYCYSCSETGGKKRSHDVGGVHVHREGEDMKRRLWLQNVIVIGGEEKAQKQIRRKMFDELSLHNDSNQNVKDVIRSIIDALQHGTKKTVGMRESTFESQIDEETDVNFLDKVDVVILGARNCQHFNKEDLVQIIEK